MRRQSILELFQSNFQLEGQSGPLVAAVKVTLRRTQTQTFPLEKNGNQLTAQTQSNE